MATATAGTGAGVFGALLQRTIGLKLLMAVTGLIWVGFVAQHMVANLQVFMPMPADGVHPLNRYAAALQSLGGLLWVARIFLLVVFVAHVYAAIRLTQLNRAARPVDYRVRTTQVSTFSSSYMRVSGFALLFFVLYHLAHFTFGAVDQAAYARTLPGGMHDVYGMVIVGFRNPIAAGTYIVANVFLALHLHHAVSSIFQTLGLRTPRYAPLIDKLGPAVGLAVGAGNIAMPLAILLGLVGQGVS